MSPILLAVLSVTAIGVICAVILAVASKLMAVPENELAKQIRACLPGANCGACGYAGCDGYAKALAEDKSVKTNLCIPGADDVSRQLSDILGVEFQDVVEKVAMVKCRGDCNKSRPRMDYQGVESCAAAHLLYSGQSACAYGCLGYGDCALVCPEQAICIENGIAHVDTRKCVGCGMCAKACPSHLIAMIADVERAFVMCNSHSPGVLVNKNCDVGCIGCRLCAKECPADAIAIVDNLATIDYEKCVDCGHCADVCKRGCIIFGDFSGAHRD
jgi:electron transport complex protein RnfB